LQENKAPLNVIKLKLANSNNNKYEPNQKKILT
jgi:hypothetical protein